MDIPTNREEITQFSLAIEELVWEKDITYMEAVLLYCEDAGFEVEVAAKLVSGALRSKIKMEAEELNFLPKSKTRKLPI